VKIVGIIPARYDSTRFQGKPLALIAGTSLIERVWHRAKKKQETFGSIYRYDDLRIKKAAEGFGAKVVMTSKACRSGTDRLAEAVRKTAKAADIVINIQGDEPAHTARVDRRDSGIFDKRPRPLRRDGRVCHKRQKRARKPERSKSSFRRRVQRAVFFALSCAVPEAPRKSDRLQHIGIYGYRRGFLLKFALWPQTPLEKAEQLEQLRILEMGEGSGS